MKHLCMLCVEHQLPVLPRADINWTLHVIKIKFRPIFILVGAGLKVTVSKANVATEKREDWIAD